MAKRSLILTSTSNQGKKLQKTFTDVNPAATSESMLTAVQMINELTTATYVQTDLVEKYNLDTEDAPSKTEPTLTLTQPGEGRDGLTAAFLANAAPQDRRYGAVTYDGDGTLCVYTDVVGAAVGIMNSNGQSTGTYVVLAPGWNSDAIKPSSFSGKVYLVATEGENYAAKTIEITIE